MCEPPFLLSLPQLCIWKKVFLCQNAFSPYTRGGWVWTSRVLRAVHECCFQRTQTPIPDTSLSPSCHRKSGCTWFCPISQGVLESILKARLGLNEIKKWHDETAQSYIQKSKIHEKACKRSSKDIGSTNGHIQKWCINSTALILLSARGQWPQCFLQLLCPDTGNLDSFVGLSSKRGYCEVPTVAGKTVRNNNVPFVAFPKEATFHIVFHSCVIHSVLMKAKNQEMGHLLSSQS